MKAANVASLSTLTRKFTAALIAVAGRLSDQAKADGRRIELLTEFPGAMCVPSVKADALKTIDAFADACGFEDGWQDKGA